MLGRMHETRAIQCFEECGRSKLKRATIDDSPIRHCQEAVLLLSNLQAILQDFISDYSGMRSLRTKP